MRRHLIFFVCLSIATISSTLHSQTTGNQPLQIKEGLWELTTTTRTTATLPEEILKPLPPEQRQQVLEDLKTGLAEAHTSTAPLCVTREHLLSGDILDDSFSCTAQLTSDGQKLNVHMQCPDSERAMTVERISATTFKGERTMTAHGSNHGKMSSTFSATWKSPFCAPEVDPHQEENLVKQGYDRDVLRLLPYTSGQGHLGDYFLYSWAAGRYPDIAYVGGAPDFPRRAWDPHLRFNGTDGTYLYVTITSNGGSICAQPDNLLKIDKSGRYTFIDHMPKGIHGGWGPPPC